MSKLEEKKVCITTEEYNAMIDMIKAQGVKQAEMGKDLKEVVSAINIMKPAVEKTQILVTGNGHPEDGMSHRLLMTEQDVAIIKATMEEGKKRRWELISPVIQWIALAIVAFIAGGGLHLIGK